jgi:hypothetical protein
MKDVNDIALAVPAPLTNIWNMSFSGNCVRITFGERMHEKQDPIMRSAVTFDHIGFLEFLDSCRRALEKATAAAAPPPTAKWN